MKANLLKCVIIQILFCFIIFNCDDCSNNPPGDPPPDYSSFTGEYLGQTPTGQICIGYPTGQ